MTPCAVASQVPLSMWFPKQEYWSGLPCLSPGNFLDSGIKSTSPALTDSPPLAPPRKAGATLCAVLSHSVVSDSAMPRTAARQALSTGFSRQEYWSGLPCPPPGDLPSPGLPHCGRILYHLNHQGSPLFTADQVFIRRQPHSFKANCADSLY